LLRPDPNRSIPVRSGARIGISLRGGSPFRGASVALGLALGVAAPAAAQSRRYPPEPVDKDAEKAAKSNLWSAAITPERHPYQDLVHGATAALAQRTADQTTEAIKKLDAAIRLLPREPEAYRLRGDAYLERKDWAMCTADFAAADAHLRRDDESPRALAELHRKLGLCQARAGKLADAERTLAETAAAGNASGEIWMRLGEVRIAMGKLDEAIAALGSALEATDGNAQAMIHFLLAEAYDRARRPGDALTEAAEGVKLDHPLAVLHNPVLPLLGAGEASYMLGLAFSASADPAKPEYALAYFRRFVKEAPDSPWRKRADDHLRDLRSVELPDAVSRNGTARLDLDAVRAAARRAMPQMRACLARFPSVVVEVEISRSGPRTPPTDRVRPRFFTPPDGVTVRVAVGELVDRDLDGVDRCLEAQANRLALPAVHEHDVYYKVTFDVVGP
jgi:tetratricopeptide (TPR) repeat protein